MAKMNKRTFKAAVTGVKLKGKPIVQDEEFMVEEPAIVVTMKLTGTKTNIRLMDFLKGLKDQKQIDVTLESAQFELINAE